MAAKDARMNDVVSTHEEREQSRSALVRGETPQPPSADDRPAGTRRAWTRNICFPFKPHHTAAQTLHVSDFSSIQHHQRGLLLEF